MPCGKEEPYAKISNYHTYIHKNIYLRLSVGGAFFPSIDPNVQKSLHPIQYNRITMEGFSQQISIYSFLHLA